MSGTRELTSLALMADMAGCPNRCRHCWLGDHPDGRMTPQDVRDIAGQFRAWRDEEGGRIEELGVFTWWREPDYRADYRALWALEQELSSPGRALRFELLSTWRLARDPSYAPWAASIGTRVCQITFFGMEDSTDWGMRRSGAYRDQLLATKRCIEAGIAPRWQLFITKRCLHELEDFLRLIANLRLRERCEAAGLRFEMFVGGISPEGAGYDIEDGRLEEGDLDLIPGELAAMSRDGLKRLGSPERALMAELTHADATPNVDVEPKALAIDANFDVYPNLAEPAPWWRLGNLREDGAAAILKAYLEESTPGMRINRTIPLFTLARQYGDPAGRRLYERDDLICRLLHQAGVDAMGAH